MKKYMILFSVLLALFLTFENVMAEASELVNSNYHAVVEHMSEDCAVVNEDGCNINIDSFSHHTVLINLYPQESQFNIWKPPVIS